jgi:hypothetical protein
MFFIIEFGANSVREIPASQGLDACRHHSEFPAGPVPTLRYRGWRERKPSPGAAALHG